MGPCVKVAHGPRELLEQTPATSEYDRSLKPILAARAVSVSFVDAQKISTRSAPVKRVGLHTYTAGKVSVAWSYDGETHSIPLPARAKSLDAWGNRLKTSNTTTIPAKPIQFVRPGMIHMR